MFHWKLSYELIIWHNWFINNEAEHLINYYNKTQWAKALKNEIHDDFLLRVEFDSVTFC